MANETSGTVYVRVQIHIGSPPGVLLRFPNIELARYYYTMVRRSRKRNQVRPREPGSTGHRNEDCQVLLNLPSDLGEVKIESSRSLRGLMLRFKSPRDAKLWADPIFFRVPGRSRSSLFVKQCWQPNELEAALRPSTASTSIRDRPRSRSRERSDGRHTSRRRSDGDGERDREIGRSPPRPEHTW
ncbi:hypothetical protein N656DRAFT_609862 [Canariomyces notabilis]|uniref:Uncharacterized protein n=1 Tax=Canariomyces notabilis TaxID=2074819 RepID=A0AAN6TGH6_9PEZI|nr:hypothetical protein N656DRAFT_609862 [Canariomyces arenarius]